MLCQAISHVKIEITPNIYGTTSDRMIRSRWMNDRAVCSINTGTQSNVEVRTA
jgi:hypothetical protein